MKKENTQESANDSRSKTLAIDRGLFWLINHYIIEIILAGVLICAFLIRWILSNRIVRNPSDYNSFLLPWCMRYRSLGIREGLAQNFTDYYVPYNIALAVIGILFEDPARAIGMFNSLFDFISSYYIYKLGCWYFTEKSRNVAGRQVDRHVRLKAAAIAITMLYLPISALNAAYWKQCDGVYTCFLVISLYYFLREKYNASLINFAIAFCFKLQAIFLLPLFFIGYIVRQRYSLLQFLWIPTLYFLAGIPAVIMGRSMVDTYGTYFAQTQEHSHEMIINSVNFYALGFTDGMALEIPAIIATIGIFLLMAALVYQTRSSLTDSKWLLLAVWIPLTCYMFLPKMHERYDFCAIILLCIYSMMTMHLIPSAVLCVLCELLVYNTNLFNGNPFPNSIIAIVYCLNYFYITYSLCCELRHASDTAKQDVEMIKS